MRPTVNQENKIQVKKSWGDHGKSHVCIPQILDDNNHWISGVDLYDQKINYYHPYICCHIKWIPMLIHLLFMIIFNSCICYVSHYTRTKHYKPVMTHNNFSLGTFIHLLNKDKHYDVRRKINIKLEEEKEKEEWA